MGLRHVIDYMLQCAGDLMIWLFPAAVAAGYLAGSFPTAWVVMRRVSGKDSDVRLLGDGNVGATNLGRLLGPHWGILVAVVDMAKGMAVVSASNFLDRMVQNGGSEQVISVLGMLSGAGAMAGHIWPVWLGWRGGRGAATAVGIGGTVLTTPMLIMALPTALILILTRNTSIAFGVFYFWSLVIGKAFLGVSWGPVLYCWGLFVVVALTDPRLKRLGNPISRE